MRTLKVTGTRFGCFFHMTDDNCRNSLESLSAQHHLTVRQDFNATGTQERMSSAADYPTPLIVRHRSLLQRWRRCLVAAAIRLGNKAIQHGSFQIVNSLLRSFLLLIPSDLTIRIFLTRVTLLTGDVDEARKLLSSITIDPIATCSSHLRRVASLKLELDEFGEAADLLKAAQQKRDASFQLWSLFARLHQLRGETERAVECYARAEEEATSKLCRISSISGAAYALADAGRSDAEAYYKRIIAIDPKNGDAYFGAVDANKEITKADPLFAELQHLVSEIDPDQRQPLHFALAMIHERSADYGGAFSHWMLANQIRHRNLGSFQFDIKANKAEVDARCRVFNIERIAEMSRWGMQDKCIICIVGMPRSGTTLVEQMLGSHPAACAIGERSEVQNLAFTLKRKLKSKMQYPDCCAELLAIHIEKYSQSLLDRFHRIAGNHNIIVTKMPQDYMELGLIAILFKNVRIVHCERNPIDTCFSCFCSNFGGIHYAASLDDLAAVYRDYQTMMRHWHKVIPAGLLMDVSYEELVTEPSDTLRRLCEFCGIPYFDACLDFYTRSTPIHTMSRWQVKQPIFQSSVGRSRHYLEFLEPLLSLEKDREPVRTHEGD